MKFDCYSKEVLQTLKTMANKEKANSMQRYINTELPCLGLTVPQQRRALQKGYSFFELSEQEILRIWNAVFMKGTFFEMLSQPLIYYSARKDKLNLSHLNIFKSWVTRIDNWEHSDRMSDLLASLRERYPVQVFALLQKWNTHKNPWFRRQSLVSIFYYSSQRSHYPPFIDVVALTNNLISDKHLYVQKAVGWTLRELYNVYPDKTYAFLLEHAHELAPAAWQAATEKLTSAKKARLLTIRKSHYSYGSKQ